MNGLRLSENEHTVMTAWRDVQHGYALAFYGVECRCDIDKALVRRTVRACARKGLLEYKRGLWSEDGEPAGAGYALTASGQRYLAGLERETERKEWARHG